MKYKNQPIIWLINHPHQGLWTWNLIELADKFLPKFLLKIFFRILVYGDSFILWLNLIFGRRTTTNKTKYTPETPINYFDLGTHSVPKELEWISKSFLRKLPNPYKIYAFEANPDSYQKAKKTILDIPNAEIFNYALVQNIPPSGVVRLYLGSNSTEDSLYRVNDTNSIDVPALKFSDFLKNTNFSESINLLRMNIEGAENDIIQDLVEADLLDNFAGFYGMWDDLSKIDFEKDLKFRTLLKEKNITPFTFNGRDMRFSIRKNLILRSLKNDILRNDERISS